jgi:iron complex outermembrane receptor protein
MLKFKSLTRSHCLSSGLLALWCLGALTANAATATFEIEPQDLSGALKAFAVQSHREIFFAPELARGRKSQGLKGQFDDLQALNILLKGTGLNFSVTASNAILVRDPARKNESSPGAATSSSSDNANSGKEGKNESSQEFRMAQVDQSAAGPQIVNNQKSEKKEEGLSEIVVTAQKREERLIDVPISIVVLTAEELQKRQIVTLEDLPFIVPGLSIVDTGNNRQIFLRGVSNTIGTSLVGLYLDEADVTLGGTGVQIDPNVYDLERVEVLRGPQGTLYGEGSAGGTIRFITNKPNLKNFAFDSDVAALFTDGGAPSQRVNAMVNVPLIDSQLGLRIVGTSDHEGGWINQPAADLTNINNRELTNVRVEGLWKPNGQFTASAMAVINRDDRGVDVTDQNSSSNWTQVLDQTTTPREKNNYDLYNLALTVDTSAVRVLSTTTYLRAYDPIFNASSYYLEPPGPGSPLWYFYTPVQTNDDDALTQELRLNSNGSGPWQWTVGAFYRKYTAYFNAPANYFAQLGPPGTPLSNYDNDMYATVYDISYKSWSGFANTSYTLWDRLTVGAGVRYFHDDQVENAPGSPTETAQFRSVDPRFFVQYKLAENFNLYSSASKGFRSGGFNGPGIPTYGPEDIWTYELGTKMTRLESRVDFDTALFWTNYTNFQTSGRPPGTAFPILSNVGDARVKGVEWDLTWRPADRWSLSFNGDYLDSRFLKTTENYDAGDNLDVVPKYQFTLSGERDFTWSGKHGFARLDYSQQGRETFRFRAIGPWVFYESDVIHTLNYNMGLRWTENLSLNLFAQNLLNEQGFTNPFAAEGGGIRPRPRTVGIGFGVKFD